jgi:tripartite-type tricarboxylate transporter receptor subunit TctC
MLTRRQLLAMAAASLAPTTALADQDYPNRLVRIIVPYPPGGPTDLLGRLAAQNLAAAWKQPVIVENKPGASGSIGSELVARAPPDGYTLLLGNNASQGTYELLNPAAATYVTLRDFAPVALIGVAPQVLIIGSHLKIANAKELVAYAKAHPGRLNYGSSAIGSAPHLAAELLKLATQTDIQHIPYNGAAPVMQAIVAGTIDLYIGAPSTVMPHVQAGTVRAVGAVSPGRIGAMPDLPTLREQGIDVVYDSWFGLLAPARVPAPILDRVNADLNATLAGDPMQAELAKIGFDRRLGSRADFGDMLRGEIERTRELIVAARITAQ